MRPVVKEKSVKCMKRVSIMNKCPRNFLLPLALILSGLISCSNVNLSSRPNFPAHEVTKESAQKSQRDYVLQPGDLLEIKYFYSPELNEVVKVRPDGKISLQVVDEVEAAGLTPSQLDKILTEKYSNILRQPEITVIVREFAGHKVYVGGEVNAPGLIPIPGKTTCLQAIFQAGGFKNTAKLKSIVILRNQGTEKPLFITLDLSKDLKTPISRNDTLLHPYDIVYVPRTLITEINQFVDQYIEKLIPISKSVGFTYFYNLRPGIQ